MPPVPSPWLTGRVSYIGTGGEDWVEFDLDLFERRQTSRLHSLLDLERVALEQMIGSSFDVETDDVGSAFLVVDGSRRYRAEVSPDDRLVLTGILPPEGPL